MRSAAIGLGARMELRRRTGNVWADDLPAATEAQQLQQMGEEMHGPRHLAAASEQNAHLLSSVVTKAAGAVGCAMCFSQSESQ